jgi:hypothetical protein
VSACPSPSLGSSCPAEGPYLLCSDGVFWPSSWRAPSCRQVHGSVGSNTTASTAREVVASQNRPGEHEKKSKGVAVAEKCSRSDGAEEWARLKKRRAWLRGCMLHDCCIACLLGQQSFERWVASLISRQKERMYHDSCLFAKRQSAETFRTKEAKRLQCMHAYSTSLYRNNSVA